MKVIVVVIHLCVAISLLPYLVISKPTSLRDVTRNFQFNYVGSADGKSYFADKSTPMTWIEAKSLCASSRMHLSSIKTAAQLTALKFASNTTAFTGEYWTGGRDAQTHSQFVWDFDKVALTASTAGVINAYQSIQTCVYYIAETSHLHLHSGLCTQKRGILCEVVT